MKNQYQTKVFNAHKRRDDFSSQHRLVMKLGIGICLIGIALYFTLNGLGVYQPSETPNDGALPGSLVITPLK